MAGADATLLWAPDTVHPLFLCIGADGPGSREVPAALGAAGHRARLGARPRPPGDRARAGDELTPNDPFVRGLPPTLPGVRRRAARGRGAVVALLVLFFTQMPDAEHGAGPPRALPRAGGAGARPGAPLRAQDRRDAPRDRAADQPLRPLEGLRLDDRHRRALDADRPQGGRLRDGARRRRSGCSRARTRSSLAASAVNDNYDVEIAARRRRRRDRRRRRRRPGVRAPQPDPRGRPGRDRERRLPGPLGPRRAPRRGRDLASGRSSLANKRGRHPEFTAEDEELLQDLARQAVRALRTARQHEAEKKVEELDALLAVSREITSTLDLDKVMQTIVNATSALITYDRCAHRDPREGEAAARGDLRRDRGRPARTPTSGGSRSCSSGSTSPARDVSVTQTEDGEITADRPETEEKFRAVFQETGLRSFYGVLLKDEEGKLGVLGFESKEPLVFDEETRDLLSILVNQATVAVRNAQLYRQVPLAGFLKPLLERQRQLSARIPKRRRRPGSIGDRRRGPRSLRPPVAAAHRRAGPRPPGPPRVRDVRRRRGRRARSCKHERATASRRARSSPPSRTRRTRPSSPRPGRRSRSRRATSRAHSEAGDAGAVFDGAVAPRRSSRPGSRSRDERARAAPGSSAPVARRHRDAAHRGARRAGASAAASSCASSPTSST